VKNVKGYGMDFVMSIVNLSRAVPNMIGINFDINVAKFALE
jgi:hypothetical protein